MKLTLIVEEDRASRVFNMDYSHTKGHPDLPRRRLIYFGHWKDPNTHNTLMCGVDLTVLEKHDKDNGTDLVEKLRGILPDIYQGGGAYQRYHRLANAAPDIKDAAYRTYRRDRIAAVTKDMMTWQKPEEMVDTHDVSPGAPPPGSAAPAPGAPPPTAPPPIPPPTGRARTPPPQMPEVPSAPAKQPPISGAQAPEPGTPEEPVRKEPMAGEPDAPEVPGAPMIKPASTPQRRALDNVGIDAEVGHQTGGAKINTPAPSSVQRLGFAGRLGNWFRGMGKKIGSSFRSFFKKRDR